MKNQPVQPRGESAGSTAAWSTRDLHEELRRAVQGDIGMYEAFQTYRLSQEEQARTAAQLLEEETWAITGILAAGSGIWGRLPNPKLRFALELSSDPGQSYLELGTFSHLASLAAPTGDEHTLIAATSPCFARVQLHPGRAAAGLAGALACSYTPISVAEAVAVLGFARIVTEIEAAMCTLGHALLGEADAQRARQEHLLRIERQLGWEPASFTGAVAVSPPNATPLALLGAGQYADYWLVGGAASASVTAFLCGLLLVNPLPLLAMIAACTWLLRWKTTPGLSATVSNSSGADVL